ncbi:OLC1v1001475C1 [Oldenlandia corymbosa var. corymbosa]|uniref:Folylpolyglutamate synthase n=1 Tax=Oldenlandia corymbosa var. corymbosa TaxID=529605 RepID=A0AAV1D586_OLDCO|nr:OLC1v1001475C1 [Oldenlandia corymbosa var. corymbosa]
MLVHLKPYLSQNLLGRFLYHSKNCQVPCTLAWKPPGLLSFGETLYFSGVRELHSQMIFRHQGFSISQASTQTVEMEENNMMTEEETVQLTTTPTSYESAMDALSSLITRQKRGDPSKIAGTYSKLDRMSMYTQILGLEKHLAGLKIIHVAGTKGKGSTCAFCEAIMRECGFRTGLFTSPHLIDVRERFRINGFDITEDKFLLYFWDCWNQLKKNVTDDLPMPPLFQFLTVLAFKIFVEEKVDVAIIEVGLGGTNDSTNVIKDPVVCGIASLGMDHMESLGHTLGEIATHKAGILKPQVPAFSVSQLSEAMDVLRERANKLMVPLEVVEPLDHEKINGIKLSLAGDHQYTNAALAVSLCKSWLQTTGNLEKLFQQDNQIDGLPEPFLKGLSTARLSGRAQVVYDCSSSSNLSMTNGETSGDLIFYLDGAHSPESMEACGRWFSSVIKDVKDQSFPHSCSEPGTGKPILENGFRNNGNQPADKISKQILLFNCMDVRDPQVLLQKLESTCAPSGTHFSKAIFVPSISTYSKVTSGASVIPFDSPAKDLTWQFKLQRTWERIIHGKDFPEKTLKNEIPEGFPHSKFLNEDVSHCNPAEGYFACSSVVSSLPQTINWLRHCVKENPSLKLQVLVTGSLHLVGDVLKLIRR